MRKLLVFVISTAMIVGGFYLLAAQMLIILGAYLLWTDIVVPMLGIKTAEDRHLRTISLVVVVALLLSTHHG